MRLSFDGGRIDERGVAVDAGLNARRSGEAFGLSIAEFLSDSRKAVQCVTRVAGLDPAARSTRFLLPVRTRRGILRTRRV